MRLTTKRAASLCGYRRTETFGKVVGKSIQMTILIKSQPKKTPSETLLSSGLGYAMRVIPNRFASALLLSVCCLLTACEGPSPAAPAEPKQDSVSIADPTEIAKQTVADFLSTPITEITPVSMESKDFSDASLDCPVSGMAYAQVITPGHRIVVEAEGRRFDVRVSGGSGRICRKPSAAVRPAEAPPERADSAHSATR